MVRFLASPIRRSRWRRYRARASVWAVSTLLTLHDGPTAAQETTERSTADACVRASQHGAAGQGQEGDTFTKPAATESLLDIQRAAERATQDALVVQEVRDQLSAYKAPTSPALDALVRRLRHARRQLQRATRPARKGRDALAPDENALAVLGGDKLDPHEVLAEQRELRAEAAAVLHRAAHDAEVLKAAGAALERARAAATRASRHADAANAGVTRLRALLRDSGRGRLSPELDSDAQHDLACAMEANARAREQAARARSQLALLQRLFGLTSGPAAERAIASRSRALAQVHNALQALYATWERIDPLHYAAARQRAAQALEALSPDASATEVRDALRSAEAGPSLAF